MMDNPTRVGDYVVVAELDREPGLRVLRAIKLGRPYAIELRRTLDPSDRHALILRAAAASAIEHPRIARIIETGEHDGELFIVREFVEGVPLTELVAWASDQDPSPLTPGHVATLIADLAEAVGAIHDLGEQEQKLVWRNGLSARRVLVNAMGEPHLTFNVLPKIVDNDTTHTSVQRDLRTLGEMIRGMLELPAGADDQEKLRAELLAVAETCTEDDTSAPNVVESLRRLLDKHGVKRWALDFEGICNRAFAAIAEAEVPVGSSTVSLNPVFRAADDDQHGDTAELVIEEAETIDLPVDKVQHTIDLGAPPDRKKRSTLPLGSISTTDTKIRRADADDPAALESAATLPLSTTLADLETADDPLNPDEGWEQMDIATILDDVAAGVDLLDMKNWGKDSESVIDHATLVQMNALKRPPSKPKKVQISAPDDNVIVQEQSEPAPPETPDDEPVDERADTLDESLEGKRPGLDRAATISEPLRPGEIDEPTDALSAARSYAMASTPEAATDKPDDDDKKKKKGAAKVEDIAKTTISGSSEGDKKKATVEDKRVDVYGNEVAGPDTPRPPTPAAPAEKGGGARVVLYGVLALLLVGIFAGGGYAGWVIYNQQQAATPRTTGQTPTPDKVTPIPDPDELDKDEPERDEPDDDEIVVETEPEQDGPDVDAGAAVAATTDAGAAPPEDDASVAPAAKVDVAKPNVEPDPKEDKPAANVVAGPDAGATAADAGTTDDKPTTEPASKVAGDERDKKAPVEPDDEPASKPESGDGKPEDGDGKPEDGDGKPDGGDGKPTDEDQPEDEGDGGEEAKPEGGETKDTETGGEPETNDNAPNGSAILIDKTITPRTEPKWKREGKAQLAIYSTKPGQLFVDGKRVGPTPIFVIVEPGSHKLRFVTDETERKLELSVTVEAGTRKMLRLRAR